jgi:hypothetical protein
MKDQDVCPICGDTEFKVLHRLRIVDNYKEPETRLQKSTSYHRNYILFEKILERRIEEFEVEFRLCRCCGLIFFSPRPDEADLAIKYKLVVEQRDTVAREQLRRLVDLRPLRADRIRQLLEPYWRKNSGRALDVGGADGHCLAGLTSEFDCGILDFETRNLWPGVKKWGNSLEDLGEDERFDVILCCHTLEHISNVTSFVEKIVNHMSQGGILYIEVPYGCAGEIYQTTNLLTHLNFFSEGSLGFLLEQAGLHVEYMASRPVLSSNRYLPVVVAIARKDESRPVEGHYLENGFLITRRQMSRSIDKAVAIANARLVLSRPFQYAAAFVARSLRGFALS